MFQKAKVLRLIGRQVIHKYCNIISYIYDIHVTERDGVRIYFRRINHLAILKNYLSQEIRGKQNNQPRTQSHEPLEKKTGLCAFSDSIHAWRRYAFRINHACIV